MPITLTEKAATEIKRVISEQQSQGQLPDKIFLRIRIVGGGCSGLQNRLDLDVDVHPQRDETYELHGVPVVVDKRSILYVNNITVDYREDNHRRGFSIHNPLARTMCGCGSSHG